MREKLLDLMKNEGLKPSQLAEMLEINPAGISHILAGRNKPGFDLLQKILRRFPQINPDWLLLDNGPMYRATQGDGLTTNGNHSPGRTPVTERRNDAGTPATDTGIFQTDIFSSVPAAPENSTAAGRPAIPAVNSERPDARVDRIVIFYDDQTFETYSPTKR